jgi:hypothetical protein
MKKSLLILTVLCTAFNIFAQQKHPAVIYMEQFGKEFDYLQELQIDYLSNLVHGTEGKAEQKRAEAKAGVEKALERIAGISEFENDKGLKEAALNAFEAMKEMAEVDYNTLIEKKAGCTNCFEAMEAEYEISNKEAEKVNKALEKWNKKIDDFAKEHEITLIEKENEFDKIIAKVNRINDYLKQIDLCVAEANFANEAVFKAFSAQDIKAAKKEVNQFKKAVSSAQKRLKSIERIPEDAVTGVKAKLLLDYYEKMGKDMYPDMLKAFDKKGRVSEKGAKTFNKNIDEINKQLPKRQNAYLERAQEVLKNNVPKPEKTYQG